jgi:hypothetical protein
MKTNNFNDDLNINTVQSYEDACQLLGIKPTYPKFVQCAKIDRPSMIAYHKLIIIIRALNLLSNGKCWIPNFNNHEYKYGLWWYITSDNKPGSAFTAYTPSYANAYVGSRLLFRSRSLAEYCAKQFKDLWQEYLIINQE